MILKCFRALLLASMLAAPGLALGQSSPGLQYKQVPTAAQWNSFFSSKQDLIPYTPVNKAGDIMLGPFGTGAASASAAGFNVAPGVAPTTPKNGDMWVTSAGLYVEIGGSTIGPINQASGTVTSVGASVPAGLAVSGSPVTGAGTLAISWSGQIPSTSMPAFSGDCTTVAGATALTCTSIAHVTTAALPTHGLLVGEGGSPISAIAPGASGTVLMSAGSGADPAYKLPHDSFTVDAVADYNANNTGSGDTTTAMNVAIAAWNTTCGVLHFPMGTYEYTNLTSGTCNGGIVRGDGDPLAQSGTGNGTIFASLRTGSSIGWVLSGQKLQIRDITFTDAVSGGSGGYELEFNNCFLCSFKNLSFYYVYQGLWVHQSTQVYGDNITFRFVAGSRPFYYDGTLAERSNGLNISNIIGDDPPQSSLGASSVKTWVVSTPYSVGNVADVNGYVWQVVTAGTSAASGTGPAAGSGAPYALFNTAVADGSVSWKILYPDNLIWLVQENYADSLIAYNLIFLDGANCFQQYDSANTGTSYPTWAYITSSTCDHPYKQGYFLINGLGFHGTSVWLSSSLTAADLEFGTPYIGEDSCVNCRIAGGATNEVQFDGIGTKTSVFTGNTVGMGGQGGGTWYDFAIAAGMTDFQIESNHLGLIAPFTSTASAGGVNVNAGASDYYSISGNVCHGETACVTDNGTGAHKSVVNNVGP